MLIPDITSLRLLNYSVSHLDGQSIINMSISPMSSGNAVIKWLEDKILASLILILITPVMLVISIVVKLSSKGPGLNAAVGSVFLSCQFRLMAE
jgi:putative colanic acid biosynthesis UDP-glucose lipid carrier transferase